jgi:hypothetical protein
LGETRRRKEFLMNNGLVDEDKSFIGPLLIIGAVVVVVLLLAGLFMPTADWIF